MSKGPNPSRVVALDMASALFREKEVPLEDLMHTANTFYNFITEPGARTAEGSLTEEEIERMIN